jgi:hemerythrin-like metal-binding protein
VLLDLVMPGMGGEEAYKELRRAGAMVPILLTSGLGEEEILERFTGRGLAGFLHKPFTFRRLASALRKALAAFRPPEPGEEPPGDGRPAERVVWVPEYETGHPLMDAEHRYLVDLYNDLARATERGDGDPVRALLDLLEAGVAHFRSESSILDPEDPPSREHLEVHGRLTDLAHDLARKAREGRLPITPNLLNFLEDWLLCHIQREDMDLGRKLQEDGRPAF